MGTVLELNRYPVKSMAGERVEELELFEHGAIGDRQRALTWREGKRLTARVAPRMLAWQPRLNGGVPELTAPDGRVWTWDEPGLREAISESIGKDIELAEDPTMMQDLDDSLLVTFQATLDGLRGELERPVDLRRFRPNVHVDLDAEAFAEIGWEGRRLRVGDVELGLLHPCIRCVMITRDPDLGEGWPDLLRHVHEHHSSIFGINARPPASGRIRVGDPVELI